jgi:hypothetical protein
MNKPLVAEVQKNTDTKPILFRSNLFLAEYLVGRRLLYSLKTSKAEFARDAAA